MSTIINRKTARNIARVLDILASFDLNDAARDAVGTIDANARAAADNAATYARHHIDDMLHGVGLERRRSFGSRAAEAFGWIGLGATAAAGASLATRMSAEDVRAAVETVRSVMATLANDADDAIRDLPHVAANAATHLGDDVLHAVGLERRKSPTARALEVAALIAGGVAIGASIGAAGMARAYDVRERQAKANGHEAETVDVPFETHDEVHAAPTTH